MYRDRAIANGGRLPTTAEARLNASQARHSTDGYRLVMLKIAGCRLRIVMVVEVALTRKHMDPNPLGNRRIKWTT